MDGVLVVDKLAGLTSHDVVARARRILRERRVGHTGTLDPAATGVLPLVVGRATRLAKFLSGAGKSYEAVIQLGVATTTADAEGVPIGAPAQGPMPSRDAIDRALEEFRGTFLQQPPAFSAKKIDGTRSYKLARAAKATGDLRPRPVEVTAHRVEIVACAGDRVTLDIDCSAGFYVRALAHDLGERLGVGAHLVQLRRTRSGDYTLADALSLDTLDRDPAEAARRVIPLALMLPGLPRLVLTADGLQRVAHGRDLSPANLRALEPRTTESLLPNPQSQHVRLLSPAGNLVAIAEPSATPGLLHPSVVLM